MDPASAFENHDEYMHVFCAEEGIAFKLMAAIYDAKVSFRYFLVCAHVMSHQVFHTANASGGSIINVAGDYVISQDENKCIGE